MGQKEQNRSTCSAASVSSYTHFGLSLSLSLCYKKIKSSRQGWEGQLRVTVGIAGSTLSSTPQIPRYQSTDIERHQISLFHSTGENLTCFIHRGKGDMVWGLQCCEGEIGGAGKVECLTLTKEENLESHPGRTKVCWSHGQVSFQKQQDERKKIIATLNCTLAAFHVRCAWVWANSAQNWVGSQTRWN